MNRLDSLKLGQSELAQPVAEKLSSGKADKAQAILTGALEVFREQGYAAASMDRIAKTSGVSKPTLYTYFTNKEGLFVALIQQLVLVSQRHQSILGLLAISEQPLDPKVVLRKMATLALDNFLDNPQLLTLMRLIIGESERFPELAKTFVREVQKPLLENFAAYLNAQPQLNLPDPMVGARIFAGSLVHYLIIQEVMHGEEILPLERDRMIEGLVHQMMAGATETAD